LGDGSAKVVDEVAAAENRKGYCRCWRSAKFPLCDGAHNKHNERTGDNIGPLRVTGTKDQ
jgi:CDGSH-type Zn-finger protein